MNPVSEVKAALNPMSIVKFTLGALVAFAIADLLGWTDWILYPVTSAKSKFARKAA